MKEELKELNILPPLNKKPKKVKARPKKLKGRHKTEGAVRRGKDRDIGVRFEAKVKKSKKRRKNEKAGRKANRK